MNLPMPMEKDTERYALVSYMEDWCKLGAELKKEKAKDHYEKSSNHIYIFMDEYKISKLSCENK